MKRPMGMRDLLSLRVSHIKHFCIFTPKIGEMIPNLTIKFFFDGLVQPPTTLCYRVKIISQLPVFLAAYFGEILTPNLVCANDQMGGKETTQRFAKRVRRVSHAERDQKTTSLLAKVVSEGEDRILLGGGFKYFLFSPLFGEDSHFDSYFSKGLKPPTRIFFPTQRVTITYLKKVSSYKMFHCWLHQLWCW